MFLVYCRGNKKLWGQPSPFQAFTDSNKWPIIEVKSKAGLKPFLKKMQHMKNTLVFVNNSEGVVARGHSNGLHSAR